MNQSATITSKLQFTIPSIIARSVGVVKGDRLAVSEENGRIILTPMKQLVEELAGSIEIPQELKGKDIDQAIRQAKEIYFKTRYVEKKA